MTCSLGSGLIKIEVRPLFTGLQDEIGLCRLQIQTNSHEYNNRQPRLLRKQKGRPCDSTVLPENAITGINGLEGHLIPYEGHIYSSFIIKFPR